MFKIPTHAPSLDPSHKGREELINVVRSGKRSGHIEKRYNENKRLEVKEDFYFNLSRKVRKESMGWAPTILYWLLTMNRGMPVNSSMRPSFVASANRNA